jgi:hypothetical protein
LQVEEKARRKKERAINVELLRDGGVEVYAWS